jgi:UDP-GlcNAc3NAcA epimerase
MKKLLTVVGARPQFVKAAALSRVLKRDYSDKIEETIAHTGQHFDANMSDIFFTELGIPKPDVILETRIGTHGIMTGGMLADLDRVFIERSPEIVLVFGDTNSTLAAALSAAKIGIPVVHVEAGMRSWNKTMPEELNRIVTDHLSTLNLASSQVAMGNLAREGLGGTSKLVGDIMYDSVLMFSNVISESKNLDSQTKLRLGKDPYVLATFHREDNTVSPAKLFGIVEGVNKLSSSIPVVISMHPRLKASLDGHGLLSTLGDRVKLLSPVSYLEMMFLVRNSSAVLTDSGGLQKEAFFLRVPCVTVRGETEWVETIELGWNRLCNPEAEDIHKSVMESIGSSGQEGYPYGSGDSSTRIAEELIRII